MSRLSVSEVSRRVLAPKDRSELDERSYQMGYSGERLGWRISVLSVIAVAGLLASACASLPAQVASMFPGNGPVP